RRQVWWDEAKQSWVGVDVPDFKVDSAPKDHLGPFIMNPDGVGRIFVPLGGLNDGPFPEYYHPINSPIAKPLHPNQSTPTGIDPNAFTPEFKGFLVKIEKV